LREHRNIEGTFRELSGNIEGPPAHSRNIQGTFKEHSRNIQGTFKEHSRNIQGIFKEHSRNIQGTFKEHSRNIQGTFTQAPPCPNSSAACYYTDSHLLIWIIFMELLVRLSTYWQSHYPIIGSHIIQFLAVVLSNYWQ
jgi:hypothetical protein